MPLTQPVITGTGIICAAGCGVPEVWDSLRQSRSGLGPLTLFSSNRYGSHLVGQVRADIGTLAGPVRGSRSDKLAWLAVREAVNQAGLVGLNGVQPERVGIVIGATVGGMLGTEQFLARLLQHEGGRLGTLRFHECASSTELCARLLGVKGPCATVSTACSAGAMALAVAATWLQAGEADLVIAGGADSLSRLTLSGFGSLLLLEPTGCRPFDAHRTGISLGEGAAMLVVENEAHALARGARVLARLSGWGASCDAWHATAPHPEGKGAMLAMRGALRTAGLKPEEIGFVSAHGTGTPDNDAMEASALRSLFGEHLPPVASVKRFFGHTLAASGAIKAVLAVETLRQQAIPASLGFAEADPKIGFEPVREFSKQAISHVLSNSFGFGGNNVALVLSNPEATGPRNQVPADRTVSFGQRSPAPPHTSAAILGLGFICAGGSSFPELAQSLVRGAPLTPFRLQPGILHEPAEIPVYTFADFGADKLLAPDKRRRLSRFQQMALVATRRSLGQTAVAAGALWTLHSSRAAVAFGTGFGSLTDTAAFLENMFLKEERAPRPLFFTNSVHNTLASQIAIEFGFQGLNTTPVQREVTFESSLWQMLAALADSETPHGIAGAADELSPYLLGAGIRWKWWNRDSPPLRPFGRQLTPGARPLPGEGVTSVFLGPAEVTQGRLALVSNVHLGRVTLCNGIADPAAEAAWIQEMLARGGEGLHDISLILSCANGYAPLDTTCAEVARELSRLAGRHLPCGAYKQCCGEFASASGIGFAVAVGLVRGELPSSACVPAEQLSEREADGCRKVLMYTVAKGGMKGICCVRP